MAHEAAGGGGGDDGHEVGLVDEEQGCSNQGGQTSIRAASPLHSGVTEGRVLVCKHAWTIVDSCEKRRFKVERGKVKIKRRTQASFELTASSFSIKRDGLVGHFDE